MRNLEQISFHVCEVLKDVVTDMAAYNRLEGIRKETIYSDLK